MKKTDDGDKLAITKSDTDQSTGTTRLRYNGKPEIKIIHPKVPPGLECLGRIEKVLIKRRKVILDGETKPTKLFEINSEKGDFLFGVKEEDESVGCFTRTCLGSIRPFDMIIYDSGGREIIHLTRPCTFPSYLAVYSPPGSLIGTIVQKRRFRPQFKVKNQIEDCECEIRGPVFTAPFNRRNIDYQVASTNVEFRRGKISKLWRGFWKTSCPDVDKFSIDFPSDAHPNVKATLIGAAFLFNCMYF